MSSFRIESMEAGNDNNTKLCNDNYQMTFEHISNGVPMGLAERRGGVTIIRTGMPTSEFNIVFALERPESLEGLVEKITQILVNEQVPWRLATTIESSEYMKPIIDGLRLVHSGNLPGMILEPIQDLPRVPPKDLEIKEISEKDEISTFLNTGASGFGEPPGSMDLFMRPIYNLSRTKLYKGRCYLGYSNGKPVATSLRFASGNVAGIYFVSVLPDFRRRGFGEAMTWRAVMDGHRDGCTIAYLQSSNMGLPVYRRMGFRKFIEYKMWESR